MLNEISLLKIALDYLPPMSEVLMLQNPYKRPAITITDFDGDGLYEIIVGYKSQGETYVLVLKNYYNYWYPLTNFKKSFKEAPLIKSQTRMVPLFPASLKTVKGTKWGYIDSNGSFIIKPKYDNAMSFQSNGLAVVEENNLTGIINSQENYIVKPQYSSIYEFSEGCAAVIDDSGFKLIDEKGKMLTTKAYSFISSFKEGRAMFAGNDINNNYLYGYLDRDGKEVIPLKYQSANDFSSGKAVVKISENLFALINLKGEILHTYKYALVGPSGDNLLIFRESLDGKSGYMDESGKVILPPKYFTAAPFNAGRAVVNMSNDYTNKYGLIDKNGNFIIKPIYNNINPIGEYRLALGKALDEKQPFIGSIYSIADTNGKILTDFIYSNVLEYKNGLASVSDNRSTFFIDKSGKAASCLPIVPGNGLLSLQGNLIQANIDSRLSYLNKSGKVVWKQNRIIPLNNIYSVIEEKYKPNKDYLVYYPQVSGIENKGIQTNVNKKLKELSQVKPIDGNLQLDYNYSGDFSIEFFNKNLLVLELEGYNFPFGAAHGMPSRAYPHIDLVLGDFYNLKDLFKENSEYVKVISDIIGKQIKNNPEYSYVFPDTYKGIRPDQPFYVNQNTLFIYFEPYEIGPYVAGFPTFKIPFNEIMNIINTQGTFWKSFH
ncbi:MAG TPA: WG repeat-containing protein [Clostridiaceae bacterium]